MDQSDESISNSNATMKRADQRSTLNIAVFGDGTSC